MYDKIPDFHYLEGNIYLRQKRYQKAIETFNKCFSIGEYEGIADVIGGAGSYRAKYMIAFCYEKQGKLHDAVKDYINLLITRPGFKEVFIKLFDIFVTNETPEAIREFFDKYVDKSDPENYAILARLYIKMGEFEIAKQYLEDVKIDVQGLNNLKGIAHMGLQKYEEALQYFEMEYGEAKSVANYYKTLCHIILEDFTQAKDTAWKLVNSDDKKLFLTIIGELRAKFDEVKDAYFQLLEFLLKINEFDLFNDVLDLYVNSFSREDYVKYGKLMQDKGLEELAMKSYITAADRNCQDAEVYRYLAQKAFEKEMYDEALAMAAKALNLNNNDLENYALIYELYKAMGKNDEAEQINTAIKAVYEEIDLIELTAKYRF
jgi:tetratricopeptide (TPR) repeat protein